MVMRKLGLIASLWMLAVAAMGQVPDQVASLDPGGPSAGAAGAFNATNANTLSSFYNPAALGYIAGPEFGVTYRNLPSTRTGISNTYADPVRTTKVDKGSNTVTHVGYAFPVSKIKKGASGTLAVSYTVGGYIDDVGRGPASGLPDGSGTFSISNFEERRRSKTDFYTVAFGKTNGTQDLSYGVGLVFVEQETKFSQDGSSGGVGFTPFDLSSRGSGLGAIAGLQYTPPRSPNMSFGLSVRTPIDLKNNKETEAIYDRVPGRLLLGAAARYEGFRGGKDYLVVGAQIQNFFGGKSSVAFDRDVQTVASVGLEYNYQMGSARVPIRVGYSAAPRGGDGFGSRNTFTYGVGYRPEKGNFSVDVSWGSFDRGGKDFTVSAMYRLR